MQDVTLPEVGENIESGNVISIAVAVGDTVTKDQDLLELETDKASLPVPSPVAGVIKEILVKEGEDVKIGAVIMKIEAGASAPAAKDKPTPTSAPAKAPTPSEDVSGRDSDSQTKTETSEKSSSPAPKQEAKAVEAVKPTPVAASTQAQKDVAAAPSVRRFAREIGIDISKVPSGSPSGRIKEADVKAYAKQLNQSGGTTGPSGTVPQKSLPDFSKFGEVEREKMSKIRTVTAEHLSYCWQTIPHVTQTGKADITELEKLRKKYSKPDRKLTITPFLLKVMASALKVFPQFNAAVDMQNKEIIYKKYINLGVAVDTPNGLLVPVIRDVDSKSIFEINDEVMSVAERARDKKVSLDDLRGGCMTLTNLGGIFGDNFTPIVNWPEVAILGISRGQKEPVYEEEKWIPRLRLPMSLSYDHRIIDGADGARFLKWVCEAIESPFMLELGG